MEPLLLGMLFLRLAIPLAIFRWPLPGALAAMIIDGLDYPLFSRTIGVPPYYLMYDKLLDTYYLSIEFIVSLRWVALPRLASMALYVYRLAGVALFMATRINAFFFFFPNVFELFFILELLRARYFRRVAWTARRLAAALILLLLTKLPIEYLLHIRYIDPFTFVKTAVLSVFQKWQ